MEKQSSLHLPGQRLPETRELFLVAALRHAYDQGDDAISERLEHELAEHLSEQAASTQVA